MASCHTRQYGNEIGHQAIKWLHTTPWMLKECINFYVPLCPLPYQGLLTLADSKSFPMDMQNRLSLSIWLGSIATLLSAPGLLAAETTSPAATVIIRCAWPGPATNPDNAPATDGNSACTCVSNGNGSTCSCTSGAATPVNSGSTPIFTVDASSNTPATLVEHLKTATSCADARAFTESASDGARQACTPLASGSVNALLYSCTVPGTPL